MQARRRSRASSPTDPLVLFFTRGVSLATWDERGIFDREAALYRTLRERGREVAFVTYGGRDELGYADRLDGIRVLANERGLPARAYNQLLPLVHGRALAGAGVLKTNQVYGGIAALRAARLHRRPLVARCGFLWTEVADADDGPSSLRARVVADRERRLLRGADVVVVTTERLKERVRERHGVPAGRIVVIPNYVDTSRFAPPGNGARERGALAFVGRLAPEKNLGAVVEALGDLDGASLTVVGDGPLRAELERRAGEVGADVRFLGRVPNSELPEVLGRAEAFVLPSLYEGHPKAAVEAMACGLPVIGTDVLGVRDVVRDGETGVLCGTGAADLRGAIERVLGDAGLRERMGRAAHESVAELSLERIADRELEVLDRAAAAR